MDSHYGRDRRVSNATYDHPVARETVNRASVYPASFATERALSEGKIETGGDYLFMHIQGLVGNLSVELSGSVGVSDVSLDISITEMVREAMNEVETLHEE